MNIKKISTGILSLCLTITMCLGSVPIAHATLDEETKDTNMEESSHLTDYSEMYGFEPIREEGRVQVSNKARSSAPQKVTYLAVFIEFPDLADIHLDDEETLQAADMVFNSGGVNIVNAVQNPSGEIPIIPLKSYMKKYSYNRLEVEGTIFPKNTNGKTISHVAKNNRSYYKKYHAINNPDGYRNMNEQKKREAELIEGAMEAVDASIKSSNITADQVDSNKDGFIDAISFFAEAPEQDNVGWGELLWSHKSNISSAKTILGKQVDAYNIVKTSDPKNIGSPFSHIGSGANLKLNRAGYAVIPHEYFHTLGLPDLYRSNGSGTPVGFYDIMADTFGTKPQGITALMRKSLENSLLNSYESKIETITSTSTVTLQRPTYTDRSERTAIRMTSPLKANEYFVAEFYEKEINQGNSVGQGDGILISRVNESYAFSNIEATGPTTDPNNFIPDYLYFFRPNDTKLGQGKGTLSNAVLLPNAGESYGFTDKSVAWDKGTMHFSDGSNSGIKIQVKNATQNEITLEITMPAVSGTGTLNDPYLLSKPSDFDLLRGNSDKVKHYKLVNDIDFTGVPFQTIDEILGSLDGNNKKLSNIEIQGGNGIFRSIDDGDKNQSWINVKDLTIENIKVTNAGGEHTGTLAGTMFGNAKNIKVTSGNVIFNHDDSNQNAGAGGLFGTATDSAVIENSYTSANVTGGQNAGGFVGLNQNATFVNSFANGKVSNGETSMGGFIGGDGGFINPSDLVAPSGCAFDIEKTGQNFAQGNKNVKGVTGYKSGQDKITLDLNGVNEKNILITTNPTNAPIPLEVSLANDKVAKFDDAKQVVYGITAGTTDLIANIKVGTNAMPLKIPVEVIDTVISKPIDSVVLNKDKLELMKGLSETLMATVNPSDTTEDKTLTWKSSNEGVASVDATGKVTAKTNGTTIITVTTSNGKTATCTVTVKTPIDSVSLNKASLTLNKGTSESLIATINPNDTTEDKTLTWKSSNESVASIDATGKVTAKTNGTTTITVTTSNGKTATCTVTVTTIIPIESVSLNKTSLTLNKGTTETLIATINPNDTTDDKTLTWKSSNESVASIDATGKVTAKTNGTTTITVTTSNGKTATCTVTVKTPIESVSLNKTSLTLNKGTSDTLIATINPNDTTDDKTLTWKSSNEGVASVDATGKVTAKTNGTTTITVTTSNGKTATCTVTVITPIESVSLNKTSLTLDKGISETLKATINPSDTTEDKTLTWKSSNESVASVDVTGKIVAKTNGTTTITVTTSNGKTATCIVTVKTPIPIVSVSLNKTSLTLNKGTSDTLKATINPNDTTDDKTLTWKSSNLGVASVDATGKVTAKTNGTTTITVTTSNGKTATCTVTVKVPIESVSLNKTSLTLNKGTSDTLIATINPNDTTDDKTLTWKSSNEGVASVDATGKVTAKTNGTTTITVTTSNGKTATCIVTVKTPIESVSLNKTTLTLNKGTSDTLTATINPSDTTEDKTLTWKSSNEGVASVDATGKVTAKTNGTTTITVTTSNGKTATCTVMVKTPIESVSLNKTTLSLIKGTADTLTATINPNDTTDDKTVTWKSSNEGVASVDATGKVTAKTNGTTIITVTTSNGKTATCTVTVKTPIDSVSLNKASLTLNKGTSESLIATINPNDTTDDKTLTWKSSNESVASIDATGKVIAKTNGTTIITVTTSNGKTASSEIRVTNDALSISVNKESLTLTKNTSEQLIVELLPLDTTDIATWSWSSKDESIARVNQSGKVEGVKKGETTIIVSANLKTKRVLTKEIKVKVVDSLFDELADLHTQATTYIDDDQFIKGAPKSFVDNLNQKIEDAKKVLDKGEAVASIEEIKKANEELKQAIALFNKVEYLISLQTLFETDLSLYDVDTTSLFLSMKTEVQEILNDPLTHSDRIEDTLIKFQQHFNVMVVLDNAKLKEEIKLTESLILSNYIDGVEKDTLLKSLENAKQKLDAKTNREFQDAYTVLQTARLNLQKLEKASQAQLDRIAEALRVVEEKLASLQYTDEYKKIMKDLIANAKYALDNKHLLTVSSAKEILESLENASKFPSIDNSKEDKEEVIDKENVDTGDQSKLWVYVSGLGVGCGALLYLKRKIRKTKTEK